jgi:predicted ATPase/serine/threonine protein kinase
VQRQVVARVSRHALRLEREFQLCKQIFDEDPASRDHFVRPVELIKCGPRHGEDSFAISIFEAPGPNYLRDLVNFGPNSYLGVHIDSQWTYKAVEHVARPTLQQFMDFAIGATTCLEILHHRNRVVHGEIRGDAFHFNEQTGQVKMINFGSGSRAFESGLSSAGWYTLSREFGIEHKLTFIAPEQTGRLPAQPDGRTDIYSLGVLFWCMLTGETPFRGDTPLIIMQNVLSRRIPYVSSRRLEVPDALSSVISKMAHRNIDSRYNSVTGLKYDLTEIRRLLDAGDLEALQTFEVATKDVSSYFTLPTGLVGRKKEQDQITHTIDAFYTTIQRSRSKRSVHHGSAHSTSELLNDTGSIGDGASETGSRPSSGGGASLQDEDHFSVHKPLAHSQQTPAEKGAGHLNSMRRAISMKEGNQADIRTASSSVQLNAIALEATTNLFRQGSKTKGPQACQVISIVGATGLGKSSVLQSIQGHVRTRGYYAFAKFDQVRTTPFGPMLRVLSSLFRQIFSEADVSTELHEQIRAHVRPAWSVLHSQLDLPLWILSSVPKGDGKQKTSNATHSTRTTAHKGSGSGSLHDSGNVAADWLRSGGTTKSSRFMNMFVGVFQIIASSKFVCVCLDDLQYADPESLELLLNLVAMRVPLLLAFTSREGEELSKKAESLISGAEKIHLKPFVEAQTAEYVSATIHRDREYVLPLVAVIQEKSAGNPFFIREILETCYRKNCLYYSWAKSAWVYDLDGVFAEFISQDYGSQVNNEFVLRRLQELPSSARLLLAWASMIGGTFSFSQVKLLMSAPVRSQDSTLLPSAGSEDAVSALQSALSVYVLVPGDDEDRFRFSHDRYLAAAGSLQECFDRPEMHYTIAKSLIEHPHASWLTSRSVHSKSRHIALALDLLKERERERSPYRQVLYDAAENSLESGARPAAIRYFSHALALLQDNPWDESAIDVSYQETLKLHIKAAEINWYQNDFANAARLVETVYKHAKSMADMAPCWIIESRIHVRQGDNAKAFECLKAALGKLNFSLPPVSFEHCDEDFNNLKPELERLDNQELISRKQTEDPQRDIIGLLLVELGSAAFWSSLVLYYQVSVVMVQFHLDHGSYPQAGLAYLYLGSIVLGRLGLVDLGCKLGNISKFLFDHSDDSFTLGRGLTLHALFIGPITDNYQSSMLQLEQAGEAAWTASDRIMSLLNIGVTSAVRVSMSQNLAEIEAFIQDTPEYPDWASDMRGGVFLVAVTQYSRALQGKTDGGTGVFDDSNHKSKDYLELIKAKSCPPERQMSIYLTFKQMALFRFGQVEEALGLGEQLVKTCDEWL